jgi:SAM-dependent methyltransferase
MLIEEKILEALLRKTFRISDQDCDRNGLVRDDALSILKEVFPDLTGLIRDKVVLDFGCGLGYQSIALAKFGAKRVIGVEIVEKNLDHARELSRKNNMGARVEFRNNIQDDPDDLFDTAILQNSFEHIANPEKVLCEVARAVRPNGKILLTFGPLWLSPHGSHMNQLFGIPWVNVLFSEAAVMKVRSKVKSDGANRYEEVSGGLNKMTVRRFEKIVRDLKMQIEFKRYDCIWKMNALNSIPFLREFFINRVSCVISK